MGLQIFPMKNCKTIIPKNSNLTLQYRIVMLTIFPSPIAHMGWSSEFFQIPKTIWGDAQNFSSPKAYMRGELGIFPSPRTYVEGEFGIFLS